MLAVHSKKRPRLLSIVMTIAALFMLGGGLYLLSLVSAPVIAPYISLKPIDPTALASPKADENRVIIPKIGVDIHFGEGKASLDSGAEWRYPDRGNPSGEGNFILAAHRFELATTPQATIAKSPFYHIDKLTIGDQIIVDYQGSRYGYEITKIYDVKPTQTEIEAPSDTAKMTLYTCTLGGSADGRVVVEARPVGKIETS